MSCVTVINNHAGKKKSMKDFVFVTHCKKNLSFESSVVHNGNAMNGPRKEFIKPPVYIFQQTFLSRPVTAPLLTSPPTEPPLPPPWLAWSEYVARRLRPTSRRWFPRFVSSCLDKKRRQRWEVLCWNIPPCKREVAIFGAALGQKCCFLWQVFAARASDIFGGVVASNLVFS